MGFASDGPRNAIRRVHQIFNKWRLRAAQKQPERVFAALLPPRAFPHPALLRDERQVLFLSGAYYDAFWVWRGSRTAKAVSPSPEMASMFSRMNSASRTFLPRFDKYPNHARRPEIASE